MGTSDETQLLARWKAGDRQAGDELLRRYFEPVHRFFRNKLDGEVGDLIQRTFLACVESVERFRGEGSFRSYVFAIARNELLQHFIRTQKVRRREVDLSVRSVIDLGTSPVTRAVRQREKQVLLRALRQIPVDLQIVLELHYWEGLTMEELAVVLDIPVGTGKSRLRRARTKLEEVLGRELEADPRLAESTTADLERWARDLRSDMSAGDEPG